MPKTMQSTLRLMLTLMIALTLVGCGGGSGSSSSDSDESETSAVGGAATKGPLANADVAIFLIDTEENTLKGEQVATGSTNSQAAISASIPDEVSGLLLVEVTSNDDTTDLTTGVAPVIPTLQTVIDADEWRQGQEVYATPLTHMVVGIASLNVGTNLDSALSRAQRAVRNTFGFDLLDDDLDLFTSPPLLRSGSSDPDVRRAILRNRKAVEAVAAVMDKLREDTTTDLSIAELFEVVIVDLASGEIDGTDKSGTTLDVDVSGALDGIGDAETLPIPNAPDNRTVADVRTIVNEERESVGAGDSDEIDEADDETAREPRRASGIDSLEGAEVVITLEVNESDRGQVNGAGTFGADTNITVTATPSTGFAFAEWISDEVDGAETASYTFSTGEDATLTAVFEPQEFTLTLEADPSRGGDPEGPGNVAFQDEASLTANPGSTFDFVGWFRGDDLLSEDETFDFSMPAEDVTLTALYDINNAQVGNDGEGGSILVNDDDQDEDESTITYTAVPDEGFRFVNWTDGDGEVTDEPQLTFDADDEREFTANFEPIPDDTQAVWNQFNWDEADWQ